MKVVEQVLKLSKEIFALEQQEKRLRAERDAKKLQLAKLLRDQSGEPQPPTSDDVRAASVPSQVLALFQARVGEPLTVEQIETDLPACDRNAIRTALSRLKGSGQIENPERGTYVMPVADPDKAAEQEEVD